MKIINPKNKIPNPVFISTLFLIFLSFFVNFFVASRGVYPVDTFIHFDPAYRILNGEIPVRDYWVVHGILVDYIQALFFLIFGNNWYAYLIHSSIFNISICLFLFLMLQNILKIGLIGSFVFSIMIAFLAYPVSGTPFLDLHSTYLSLFGIFFIIIGIVNQKDQYWFFTGILFTLAFFCKQVPAAYVILTSSIFCFFYSLIKKNYRIIIFYSLGGLLSLFTIVLFFIFQGINIEKLILQLFLFPSSIGESRYIGYDLNLKNVFFNFKFIYLLIFLIFLLIFLNKNKIKENYYLRKLSIFFIFLIYIISVIFHQIYTKNQIYIFFLIPILGGFCFYFLEDLNTKNKYYYKFIIIICCLLISIKYIIRFDVERKFHELSNTKIENSFNFENFDQKFKGLKWISPYYSDPNKEIKNLEDLRKILFKNNLNTMLLTEYKFFSLLLDKKFYSPSRTFDEISYPKKNSKYFKEYQTFLTNIIKKKEIKIIIIFENKDISKPRLNHLVFNYIPEVCFNEITITKLITKLEIKNCKRLS
jgi:hypothetical protein